jgi:outer membrane protein assembly factor BamB
MPREPKDDGSESLLGLIGVGETRETSVTRRALLFGVAGAALTGTVVAAVVAGADEDARHRRALHPPVNPGPATVRTPGSLAGPAAAPIWSVPVDRGTRAVAVGAGSVLLTDGFGDVLGFDPHTGAAKWQPSVEFFLDSDSPLTVVGDTLYGFDADGDFLAVDASNGNMSWQVEFASGDVEIATVAGNAGPLVFSTGSIYERAGGKGVLWCVNTKLHGVEFNINDVDFNLAVAASEPAGVVVTADEISYRLTAYSINDQTVVWHKDAGNADAIGVPISPADCIAVSGDGDTFYWACDRLYALDAGTGAVRWTADSSNPADKFQSVLVLRGQGPAADLIVATTTGPNGGTLRAFAADTGDVQWIEHGGAKFGLKTALAATADVVVVAEADNGSVVAVDAKTGQTRWTYHDATVTADLTWAAAADDARVYVAYGKKLIAFEP